MNNGEEYDLVIESYNTLSIAKSALKTDHIKIRVTSQPPIFQEEIDI